MNISEMLLLEKVPKLNFTVSHIIISYPLKWGGMYKIDDTEFDVYYLHTRARSETFPMILLVHDEINLDAPQARGPRSPKYPLYPDVHVYEGPFRVTIKNVKSEKFWWHYGDEVIHQRVEIIIRKGRGDVEDLGEGATKLVISGSENYVMTHTFRQNYTEFEDKEGDLVLLKARTSRRFFNYVNVFITRRTIQDILSNAEAPRYIKKKEVVLCG